MIKSLKLLALFVIVSSAQAAQPQWYTQLYPTNSNSQIVLNDANNNSVTAITNPTATTIKSNTTTNTQPPTIIVQATGPTYWKDPVADYAALIALPVAQNQVGDARKVLALGVDFFWDGAQWTSVSIVPPVTAGGACSTAEVGKLARDATTGATYACLND